MPAATPLSSVLRISGAAFCAPVRGLLRVIDTEVAQPALDLFQRLVRLRRDLARVGGDAAEDEAEDQHPDENEPHQDEDGPPDARYPVALQPAHGRACDRAEYGGEDHRHGDRRGLAEHPDEPDDDQHEPDQQPRREAQVPEPGGCRKLSVALGRHAGDLGRRRAPPHHPVGMRLRSTGPLAATSLIEGC